MCGIVVGVVDIRNQRGGEGEGWSVWLKVGSRPGLETFKGLGCHYFLGQAVPFGDGPGEDDICLYCVLQ